MFFAVLASLVLGAAGPVRAAGEVGVEAQGVSPWAVLHNRWNLDVRDAKNRPVSRRLVESQLKAAASRQAVENTYASRLPKARAMAAVLQVIRLAQWALRAVLPPPLPEAWAPPMGRRGAAKISWTALFLLPAIFFMAFLSLQSCTIGRPAFAAPLVLRC